MKSRIVPFLVCAFTALGCIAQVTTGNTRGGNARIAELDLGMYAYVPSVMDDGVFKIWYCSTPGDADHIYYSESHGLDSGWSAPTSVFTARTGSLNVGGNPNNSDFDRGHTCDPSVIRVYGTYYMYYGGNWSLAAPGRTAIGVASSQDGKTWTRMNNGQAIIRPKNEVDGLYGAGQPSVLYRGGLFYMLYTDTSTTYPGPELAKVFVLRSPDPTFQVSVDELQNWGTWVRISGAPARTFTPFAQGLASLEWRYDDMLDAVGVAIPNSTCPGCNDIITLIYYNLDSMNWTGIRFDVPGHWTEGVGLVHRPDGHAPPAYGATYTYTCGTAPVDIVRSVGTSLQPGTYRLSHMGLDYYTTCDRSRNASIFEGSLVYGSGLPLMLVRENLRLQFAYGPTALQLAHAAYVANADDYQSIPYGASLYYGQDSIYAPGLPGAYLTDSASPGVSRLWAVSCMDVITVNGSTLRLVTADQWYAAGVRSPDLYCIK